ncbi:MAG: hypothetical protein Q9218_003346 [Villophora microphyllina]
MSVNREQLQAQMNSVFDERDTLRAQVQHLQGQLERGGTRISEVRQAATLSVNQDSLEEAKRKLSEDRTANEKAVSRDEAASERSRSILDQNALEEERQAFQSKAAEFEEREKELHDREASFEIQKALLHQRMDSMATLASEINVQLELVRVWKEVTPEDLTKMIQDFGDHRHDLDMIYTEVGKLYDGVSQMLAITFDLHRHLAQLSGAVNQTASDSQDQLAKTKAMNDAYIGRLTARVRNTA